MNIFENNITSLMGGPLVVERFALHSFSYANDEISCLRDIQYNFVLVFRCCSSYQFSRFSHFNLF